MLFRTGNAAGTRTAGRWTAHTLPLAAAVLAASLLFPPVDADGLGHEASETPGSNVAYVFSANGFGEVQEAFVREVQKHGYAVVTYADLPGDDNPGLLSALTFASTSGAGILHVLTHGADAGNVGCGGAACLLVEQYRTAPVRDGALAAYLGPFGGFAPGELVACDTFNTPPFGDIKGICITGDGISRHWRDAGSLVFVGACDSLAADLVLGFNAQAYVGYPGSCYTPDVLEDTSRFFGRMDGRLDDGQRRSSGRASLDLHAGYAGRPGRTPLVLSPAVWSTRPGGLDAPAPGGAPITYAGGGSVVFDAKMAATAAPVTVAGADPCAEIREGSFVWSEDGYEVTFDVIVKKPGTVKFRVVAGSALSHNIRKALDGNNPPLGPDHVGPNGDDYEWEARCLGEEPPPPVPALPTLGALVLGAALVGTGSAFLRPRRP